MSDSSLAALVERFATAQACWFASTRPDGRAHLAPIWHVVHDDCIYVVTQANSVRAANIAVHPVVSLSVPDPMNALIIEGVARSAPEMKAEMETALQPLFLEKYDWDISTDAEYEWIIEVTPQKMMAWGEYGEGRWRRDADGTFVKVR